MNDKQINRYFKLAKNASKFSDYEKNKVGAVLVYKNKIIGVGYNRKVSCPIQKIYNKYRSTNGRYYDVEKQKNYIHAEIDCVQSSLRLFKGDYSKCSIFVYREDKNGNTSLSSPCQACSKYLKDIGIKNIYYTIDNERYGYKK